VANPVPTMQVTTEGAVLGGEVRHEAASGGGAAARTGVQDDDEGRRHVVVLTPEGGQFIGVRAYENAEHTVVGRLAAVTEMVLPKSITVEGPAGTPVHVEETCTMIFPLGGPHGRRLEIHALVVDTLEQYCGFPQDSMWKWQMQLGIEDSEILPLLQVTQPGDHRWGEMTLERVRLNSGGMSRSTWKLLVCKGQQMTETVWLNVVRA
jgi:hypothetical protein